MAYQLITKAGDSFSRVVSWSEDDGTPIDLSGASVEWSIRGGSISEDYIDSAQASITLAASGQITLTLTPTETRTLRDSGISSFKYELTITFPNGTRTTILDGSLSVTEEVLP